MQAIKIHGGVPLEGTIPISGSKNAALPLMTLSLLTNDNFILSNVPELADINTMKCLLEQHGASINRLDNGNSYELKVEDLLSSEAPYDLVRKMRASVLVLGPFILHSFFHRKVTVSDTVSCQTVSPNKEHP